MQKGLLVLALCALTSPALGQGIFGPDNPWFQDFEATCRDGDGMFEECQASVVQAFQNEAGTHSVKCDFEAFWRVRDTEYANDKYLPVLPWQYGVLAVLRHGGVCEDG